MKHILLYNATLVTGESEKTGALHICGDRIRKIYYPDSRGKISYNRKSIDFSALPAAFIGRKADAEFIDMTGLHVFAGAIDAHVHFREPGMTRKADMESESLAAVAGGVTSFIDMPNTKPATVTYGLLEEKLDAAKGRCHANYGFYIGATNENARELAGMARRHRSRVAGIKLFMGSSTGNMLVDDRKALSKVFSIRTKPVLVHAEDEDTIRMNSEKAKARYGDGIPFSMHPVIRSRAACLKSSSYASEFAIKYGTAMHLCHVSTADEVRLVGKCRPLCPGMTAETSANYLWFSDKDYDRMGSRLKCNPAVKSEKDRAALIRGLKNGMIDTIGSDHAPHLEEEKNGTYCNVPSGMPSVQQSVPAVLTVALDNRIPLTRIAAAISERPAEICGIRRRGFLREGYFADIFAVNLNRKHTVTKEELLYKCGWSPYEGETFRCTIESVFVNGCMVVEDGRPVRRDSPAGKELSFI